MISRKTDEKQIKENDMLIQRQQVKYDFIQKPEAEAAAAPVDLTD